MKISCVVCTHNRENIYKTIESLQKETHPVEIVVVDDNSKRPVGIESEGVIVIRNDTTKGLSVSRNIGYKYAKGDIVAFTDDDTFADPMWIEELEKCFQNGADIAGGLIKPIWQTQKPGWLKESMYHLIGINTYSHMILGCNFAIRKNLLEEMGYWFEEKLGRKQNNLIAGDETTLFYKAEKKNYKIIFNEKAVVYHLVSKDRTNLKYFILRFFWEGRTEARRKAAGRYFIARLWHLLSYGYIILIKLKFSFIEKFLIDIFLLSPIFTEWLMS